MALLLDQLEADWRRIAADPDTTRHLRALCASAGVDSPGALPAWARSAARDDTDAVLLGLATLARSGDHVAAVALLHVLWPGVLGLVRRWRALGDLDERASAAVNAVYARICTYPVERRPHAVAANVLLDAAKELRRQARQVLSEPVGLDPIEDAPAGASTNAADELLELLADALRDGVLAAEDVNLIAQTRIAGHSLTDVDPHGRLRTLQRRRQTAERRLAAAVAA